MGTFRDTLRRIVPRWLSGTVGEKLLYSIGVHLDAIGDSATAAVRIRYPNEYSGESLPLLGRDRRIARGRNETDEVYASRLVRWLDDHSTRGGPYALLAQLYGHYASNPFPIQLVYYSGRRFSMDVSGNVVMDDIVWDLDETPNKWARWWLFFEWPDPIGDDGSWDSPGLFDDGGVWDSDLTSEEVQDIRLVPTQWNAAHCSGTVVLLTEGHELWDYPLGTWDDEGVWDDSGPAQLAIT